MREIHVGGIASAVDHVGVAAAVDGDRPVATAVESAEAGDTPMQTATFRSPDHKALRAAQVREIDGALIGLAVDHVRVARGVATRSAAGARALEAFARGGQQDVSPPVAVDIAGGRDVEAGLVVGPRTDDVKAAQRRIAQRHRSDAGRVEEDVHDPGHRAPGHALIWRPDHQGRPPVACQVRDSGDR